MASGETIAPCFCVSGSFSCGAGLADFWARTRGIGIRTCDVGSYFGVAVFGLALFLVISNHLFLKFSRFGIGSVGAVANHRFRSRSVDLGQQPNKAHEIAGVFGRVDFAPEELGHAKTRAPAPARLQH
jgi:hypothetical protein